MPAQPSPAVPSPAPRPGVVRREPPYEINLVMPRDGRLVFDLVKNTRGDDVYRVAWYQRRRKPCDACDGRGYPSGTVRGVCKECHGRRFTYPIQRTTALGLTLAEAISSARGESEVSLDTAVLADYVHSTGWGASLPRADRLTMVPVEVLRSGAYRD